MGSKKRNTGQKGRSISPPAASPAAERPEGLVIATHRTMFLLSLASLVLLSVIFAPLAAWPPSGWWPVAFGCLVPWLVMTGWASHAPRVYLYSFLLALAFYLVNMRWLYPATGLGYVALSAYLAVYFPLAACIARHAVRRRGWRLAWAFPIIWVGGEMLRAVVISGFPWFFLSHSLHRVLALIQISDLVGAYGVTFVVASVNGALADLIAAKVDAGVGSSWRRALRDRRGSLMLAGTLVLGSLVYGVVQLHRGTTTPGPRVALIQGDFLSLVNYGGATGHDRATDWDKKDVYLEMIQAAGQEKPDLYLLPESPWYMYLNKESRSADQLSRDSFAALQALSSSLGGYIVTGSASREQLPYDLLATQRRYNSATVIYPDGREPGRYDKVHLVYFGEIVPFRGTRFHSVYRWLNSLTPFSGPDGKFEFSLFRGESFRVFTIEPSAQPGRALRFGIPICYEDVMPYVARRFVSGGKPTKQADFLANISNDGWFGRGVQQPQHLAICAFRAVENRVGIARSVNTGGSAIIDPDGRIHHEVRGDAQGRWPGLCGYEVGEVKVDSRYTLYSRYGDWFAWTCAVLSGLMFIDYWVIRVKARDDEEAEA